MRTLPLTDLYPLPRLGSASCPNLLASWPFLGFLACSLVIMTTLNDQYVPVFKGGLRVIHTLFKTARVLHLLGETGL